MKSIASLLSLYSKYRIYIFLRNEDIGKLFLKNAEREGITFPDGIKPTERHWSDIFALNKDMTINYVGFIGRVAFQADRALIKIDYEEWLNNSQV